MPEKIVMPKLGMVMSEGAYQNSLRIKEMLFLREMLLRKLKLKKSTMIWKQLPQEHFIR